MTLNKDVYTDENAISEANIHQYNVLPFKLLKEILSVEISISSSQIIYVDL